MNYWQVYWKQKANSYVSAAVLAGGLLSAVILFFLARVELGAEAFELHSQVVTELLNTN